MKKTLILLALLATVAIGCDNWDKIGNVAGKAQDIAGTGEKVAAVTSPWTFGYGSALATAFSGVMVIAGAVKKLAKEKAATQAVARAAVEAADKVEKGGSAIVKTAMANGVAHLIKSAEVQFADKG